MKKLVLAASLATLASIGFAATEASAKGWHKHWGHGHFGHGHHFHGGGWGYGGGYGFYAPRCRWVPGYAGWMRICR